MPRAVEKTKMRSHAERALIFLESWMEARRRERTRIDAFSWTGVATLLIELSRALATCVE